MPLHVVEAPPLHTPLASAATISVARGFITETVIVGTRGMSAGFAAIDTLLLHQPKTRMVCGDAKASLTRLVGEIGSV